MVIHLSLLFSLSGVLFTAPFFVFHVFIKIVACSFSHRVVEPMPSCVNLCINRYLITVHLLVLETPSKSTLRVSSLFKTVSFHNFLISRLFVVIISLSNVFLVGVCRINEVSKVKLLELSTREVFVQV